MRRASGVHCLNIYKNKLKILVVDWLLRQKFDESNSLYVVSGI